MKIMFTKEKDLSFKVFNTKQEALDYSGTICNTPWYNKHWNKFKVFY